MSVRLLVIVVLVVLVVLLFLLFLLPLVLLVLLFLVHVLVLVLVAAVAAPAAMPAAARSAAAASAAVRRRSGLGFRRWHLAPPLERLAAGGAERAVVARQRELAHELEPRRRRRGGINGTFSPRH